LSNAKRSLLSIIYFFDYLYPSCQLCNDFRFVGLQTVLAIKKPMINPADCRKFKASTRQAYVDKLFEVYKSAGFGEASHDMVSLKRRRPYDTTAYLSLASLNRCLKKI